MSGKVTDKLCQRLLEKAPRQAVHISSTFWEEAVIPKCMKNGIEGRNIHPKGKTC